MLVLSRKPQEKIVFPTLGTTIQVLEIKGGKVRLGIDAPPEVAILRRQLPRRVSEWGSEESTPGDLMPAFGRGDTPPRPLHDRLKTTGLGLGLVRLQLDLGSTEEARATLAALQADFQLLLHAVAEETESPPPELRSAEPRRQKALLVEDNANERELLATLLRRGGLQVDTAGDGVDALDYLRSRGRPDVVLLDMGLPRVDGPTTVREIRRDPTFAGLKIFGVSGHAPDEFNLARGPSGVDRWFLKPVDPAALLDDLSAALESCPAGV